MKKIILYIFFVFFYFSTSHIQAQIGGDNTYEFLNLTRSSRIAAMGGDFLTINDHDITLTTTNPSLITPEMHNSLGVAYVDYFSGVNYGFAAYSRSFDKIGSFVASISYISEGKFDYADETGERYGTFYVGENAINIGWGRQLDSIFSIGANLKFVYSSLESYKSYGLLVDVAGSYNSRDNTFTASLIAKNIGRQLKAYQGGNIEPVPFEFQIGIAKRLKHLPFRYSILYNHLEKWDLRYDDPSTQQTDPITGEPVKTSGIEEFADNLMRHIVIGGEILIGKNFSLQGGFNYKRRQEMKIESKKALVGFSWGFGFRVSKFRISYARSTYHLNGSPNYITLTTNLSSFKKRN